MPAGAFGSSSGTVNAPRVVRNSRSRSSKMAVEALPWRLYWQAVDIEVLDYPRNRIRIEVSTLSLNEEWIGA